MFRAELRARARPLIGTAIGAFAFMSFLAGTYEAIGGAEMFNRFLGSAEEPTFLSAFTGSRDVRFITGPLEYLAFGFNHPFFLVLGMLMGVAVGSDAVAGDVETGRAELIYTRPVRRSALLDARALVALTAELVVVVAAWCGLVFGGVFSDDVASAGPWRLAPVVPQFMALATFATALSLLASSSTSRRGVAVGICVGVLAAGYLAHFVSLLWEPVGWLSSLTPFGYYTPFDAIGGFAWSDAAVLTGCALMMHLGARAVVERRDLV